MWHNSVLVGRLKEEFGSWFWSNINCRIWCLCTLLLARPFRSSKLVARIMLKHVASKLPTNLVLIYSRNVIFNHAHLYILTLQMTLLYINLYVFTINLLLKILDIYFYVNCICAHKTRIEEELGFVLLQLDQLTIYYHGLLPKSCRADLRYSVCLDLIWCPMRVGHGTEVAVLA